MGKLPKYRDESMKSEGFTDFPFIKSNMNKLELTDASDPA
jgi:hypothetical protein